VAAVGETDALLGFGLDIWIVGEQGRDEVDGGSYEERGN